MSESNKTEPRNDRILVTVTETEKQMWTQAAEMAGRSRNIIIVETMNKEFLSIIYQEAKRREEE